MTSRLNGHRKIGTVGRWDSYLMSGRNWARTITALLLLKLYKSCTFYSNANTTDIQDLYKPFCTKDLCEITQGSQKKWL